MAVFGFNSMKEKIEVLSKEETYTRDEVCTNATGRPIILFNGQIKLYIWKHVSLGGMPANGHLDVSIPLGSDFCDDLPANYNPDNFCICFMTPISTAGLARDITVTARGFAKSSGSDTFDTLNLSGYNHTSQAADLLADILIIKQVP